MICMGPSNVAFDERVLVSRISLKPGKILKLLALQRTALAA